MNNINVKKESRFRMNEDAILNSRYMPDDFRGMGSDRLRFILRTATEKLNIMFYADDDNSFTDKMNDECYMEGVYADCMPFDDLFKDMLRIFDDLFYEKSCYACYHHCRDFHEGCRRWEGGWFDELDETAVEVIIDRIKDERERMKERLDRIRIELVNAPQKEGA